MEEDIVWKHIQEYLNVFDSASIQKQSYDFFIHHRLNKIIEEEPVIEIPLGDDSLYRVKFGQVFVDKPYIIDDNRQIRHITPNEARLREFTYSSTVSVNIRTCMVRDGREYDEKEHFKVLIARIPMMIGTSKCNLSGLTNVQRRQAGECENDLGGYFIIKGKERVLVSQERMNHNIVYVFDQKPSHKFQLVAEIRSMSEETGHSVLVQMKLTQNNKIVVQMPYISQEIPLGIVMRGYGLSQNDIEKILLLNIGKETIETFPNVAKIVRGILREAELMDCHERVLSYIAQFAVHNVSKERKLFYVNQILSNELFPHLGITSNGFQKVFFIAHMFSKLINTWIKRRHMDDRDHINNKRVEVSGHLLSDLFRTLFKRFVRAIEPQLQKRPDILVVTSRINVITQGIKHCFSTGNWGLPKSSYVRTGVSQILSRLTYNSYLSHLRRILIPIGKEGKNTKIRQVHPSQIGFICPHETPEGHCLTGDTQILLDDGVSTVDISSLETSPSQALTSVNIHKGTSVRSRFHSFFKVMPESLYEVTLINGASIKASGLHPFLVYRHGEDEPVWVQTQDLRLTDRLAYIFPVTRLESSSRPPDWSSFYDELRHLCGVTTFKNEDCLRRCMSEKTFWTRSARCFGALCLSLLQDSNSLIVHTCIDTALLYADMKSLLPPDSSLSLHTYELFLGRFERHFFHLLFCVNDWRENLVLPFWIREGGRDIQREFIGGFFAAFNYCYVVPDDFTPCVFSFKTSRTEEWMRCLEEINRMVNTLCPLWTLHKERDCIVWRPPQNILDVIHILGVRFRPFLHKTLSLGVLYHTVSHVWNSYETMRRCVDPYGQHSQLLFLPLEHIGALSKEITMDFTTSSSYHSFVANGFVTHNSAGIVKNMSLSTQVSVRVDTSYIRMIIEELPGLVLLQQPSVVFSLDSSQSYYKVFLNGNWIGVCQEDSHVYTTLCRYKHQNRFHPCVSVSMCDYDREIHVYTDEGRLLRPLWDVKRRPTRNELEEKDVSYFLKEKKIVFLDSYEIENKVIAMTWDEVDKNGFYDYCEIHPSLLSGLCVSIIPYAEHTQAPRVTYYASMGKQAIGYYATTHPIRTDTISHLLWYPEKPLIRTHYGLYTRCDTMATGNNLIVAICTYTGFNQEDSVIFNQSAIDRGLFRSYSFRTLIIEERKKSTNYTECIQMPSEGIRVKSFNYSKLHDDGIIKVGAFVGSGDVIVGRVQIKNVKSGVDEESDTSVIIKTGEEGFVDTVFVTKSPDGYKIVKIKIRTIKVPEIGDKVASRSAQKGTIGMVFRHEDMPFTTQGLVPDIIINPLCIPSRMTINQLIECLGAKSAAHKSIYRYSTAFSSHSTNVMDYLCNELRTSGFEPHGNECMMNGFTGEMFESTIFIGPTYYHRLKHLVSAKIHARNHGSLQVLTRQPLEGRSRDGGLRFGEMERDAIATGTPISLHCGLSVKIDDMHETGWKVLSWDKEKNGIVGSVQTEFLDKGFRECLEITLEDGRKLYPSIRHPLLTSSNEWILAQDITPGTILQANLEHPCMDIYKEIAECRGWKLNVGEYTYLTDSVHNYVRTLAFMRILGYLITDGHISKKQNYGKIFMGHILDVESILEDITLAFGVTLSSTFQRESYYDIHLPSKVLRNLLCIDGIIRGNKTTQVCKIPTFLLACDCPRYIIREFLGGMFGGDGHTCYLAMHRKKRDLLTSVSISKSSQYCLVRQLEEYMKDIQYLLERCGIQKLTLQHEKETTSSKKRQVANAEEKIYSMTLHIDKEDLLLFHQNVGFRHCLHKSMRLEAAVSYHRLRHNVKCQHEWLVQRVDELTGFSKHKRENPNKKISTKKAIEQAVQELKSTQGLLHEYAIPSTHDMTDHLVKGTSFGKFRSHDFPTAEQYIERIGCLEWFMSSRSDESISYGTRREDDFLRTMNLKVVYVKPIGPQKVFDIQVERTESFLANGVVAHNCMISHGVSRFLTERLFDMSDKFSVPVCSNCGIFPNVLDHCNGCQMTLIRRTPLPYACKLLFQELMAMGIKITLSPCEDIP